MVVKKDLVKLGYHTFYRLRDRCEKSSCSDFRYYGAKGVRCHLTKDEFLKIYFGSDECAICKTKLNDAERGRSKESRTIDRINPEGNYENGNVRVLCKSCNSSLSRGNTKISGTSVQKIFELRKSGLTQKAIGKLVSLSQTQVRRILLGEDRRRDSNGVEYEQSKKFRRLSKSDVEMIFSLRNKGLTHDKIATRIGCSRPNVSNILAGKQRSYK